MYTGELVFATNNLHKMGEARSILSSHVHLLSLHDIGCQLELPENQDTLEGNALEKAAFLYNQYHVNCFSDDTGLEVEALGGAPGVYSARFAGPGKSYSDNNNLLLQKMQGVANRKARFRTVIALILEGKEYLFEGSFEGTIADHPEGVNGFGYDPVFRPDGYAQSFAAMDTSEKNKMSHRKIALQKLTGFLESL